MFLLTLASPTYTYSNHAINKVEMIKNVCYVKFSTIIIIVCTIAPPPSKKESSTAYMACLLTYLKTCLEKDHQSSISRFETYDKIFKTDLTQQTAFL